jgi:hypothetical protein
MKPKILLVLLTLLMICGCGRPTKLEQTVSKLQPGMNKIEVKQLFTSFHLSGETNLVAHDINATNFYSTNKDCAYMIVYGGSATALEMCALYFDTNDVLVAHYYNLGD